MKNFDYKKWLPHAVALLTFIILTLTFFSPVMNGFEPKQLDMDHYKGMAKEIQDFRNATGEEPLWTNSMFGGMPAYQIDARNENNLLLYVDSLLMLGFPGVIGYFFLLFVGFYILMLSMKVNPWISIAGAVMFAFSSYIIVVVLAGHNTKIHAIAYMPAVLGGFIMLLRGRMWIGAAVFTLFFSLELLANHVQMTYYLILMLIIIGVGELIRVWMEKGNLIDFFKRASFLFIGGFFALLANSGNLWNTYEYGNETTRGKSELTITPDGKGKEADKGLDADYITQWSYGVDETFTLINSNAKGGSSQGEYFNDFVKKAKPQVLQFIGQQYNEYRQSGGRTGLNISNYWGDQPFILGPTYVGAIIVYLFLLGIMFVKDNMKWAILAVCTMIIFLSWGKNFPGYTGSVSGSGFFYFLIQFIFAAATVAIPVMLLYVFYQAVHERYKKAAIGAGIFFALYLFVKFIPHENFGDFFINLFPGYNKFRSVTFTLTVLTFTLPFMAVLFLKEVWEDRERLLKLKKVFLITSGAFLLFMLVFTYKPQTFVSMLSAQQEEFFQNFKSEDPLAMSQADDARTAMVEFREGVFKADAQRSLIFVVVTMIVLLLFFYGKINRVIVTAAAGVLVLFDLWGIDRRYFHNEMEANQQTGKREYAHWQDKGTAPYFAGGGSMRIFEMEAVKNPQLMQEVNQEAQALQQDKEIMADKTQMKFKMAIDNIIFPKLNMTTNYRVMELGDPFQNSGTSYFHKSVGGYHGAKLKRYKELIEFYLDKEHSVVYNGLSNLNTKAETDPMLKMMLGDTVMTDSVMKFVPMPGEEMVDTLVKVSGLFKNTPLLNMMNTKYVIYIYTRYDAKGNPVDRMESAVYNPEAAGPGWFTDSIKFVPDANSEMLELGKVNPLNTAVISESFKDKVKNTKVFTDKNATVTCLSYAPNLLVYETNSSADGFVVFSEIYYDKGWNAYLDDVPVDYARVNYVLRGMDVPAGKHTIEFRFEPENWYKMKKVTLAGNLLLLLLVAGYIYMEYRQRQKEQATAK